MSSSLRWQFNSAVIKNGKPLRNISNINKQMETNIDKYKRYVTVCQCVSLPQ